MGWVSKIWNKFIFAIFVWLKNKKTIKCLITIKGVRKLSLLEIGIEKQI